MLIRIRLLLVVAVLGTAQAQPSADALAVAARKGDKGALAELRALAGKGSAVAQFNLGLLYYYGGVGVAKDPVNAVNLYRKAAGQGLSVALDTLQADVSEGDQLALGQLTALANEGNAGAEESLGVLYELGSGVPADLVQSAAWYRKAAEQGRPFSQYSLGVMYRDGQGVPKDAVQAVDWYRKAAEQGFADSQSSLGTMYVDGDGVPKDLVMGYMWLNLAAAQGDEKTKRLRDALEKMLTSAQIAEGQKLGREWKPSK